MPKSKTTAAPAAARLLSDKDCATRAGVCRATWWRWSKELDACPKPRRIGQRTTRWDAAEVEAFLRGGVQ